jgi:hypothetical protein
MSSVLNIVEDHEAQHYGSSNTNSLPFASGSGYTSPPPQLSPSELSILETALVYGFRQLPHDRARLEFLNQLDRAVNAMHSPHKPRRDLNHG